MLLSQLEHEAPSAEVYAPVNYEQWGYSPTPPESHASLAITPALLTQIDEQRAAGKASCLLTAQLNALTVRGALLPSQAADVQHELATQPRFADFWQYPPGSKRVAWLSYPYALAFALDAMGIRIGVTDEEVLSENPHATIVDRLRQGYAAILLGHSIAGRHARLAFEPAEFPGQLFIHDPNYPETTGIYDYGQLPEFQRSDRIIFY